MTKENFCKISLTGELGSGKSTVCKILKEKLNAELISVGSIQRRIAHEMGMTILELNSYMETHHEIDEKCDAAISAYEAVRDRNMLFDSRLAWHFVPSSFGVYVTVDMRVAAMRVSAAGRESEVYLSYEEALNGLKSRRRSEVARYLSAYGVDISDLNNYSLVVDSTTASAETVADAILQEYNKYTSGRMHDKMLLSPFRLYPLAGAEDGGDITVASIGGCFYVLKGLDALRLAIKENSALSPCVLDKTPQGIAERIDIATLKRWETANGFTFIAYPEDN